MKEVTTIAGAQDRITLTMGHEEAQYLQRLVIADAVNRGSLRTDMELYFRDLVEREAESG